MKSSSDDAMNAASRRSFDATTEAFLDGLVAEALDRFAVDGEDGLDRYYLEHAGEADRIRAAVEALRGAGFLEPRPESKGGSFPERLGDYILEKKIGGGGMGIVYLARQVSLKRDVALKLIRPEHLYFDGAKKRFQREIDAVSKLSHRGIVPIYAVGEEEGVPFFAMPRLIGATAAELLDELAGRRCEELTARDIGEAVLRRTSISLRKSLADANATSKTTYVDAIVRIVADVAEALDHAHEAGVLHRDIKPSNIMLGVDGTPTILDFGLASLEGVDSLTRTGAMLGSLPYMAPEQIRGRTDLCDRRADVYSLGVVLYELAGGRLPYFDPDGEALRRRILEGNALPLARQNSVVPWELDVVCRKAIDPDPAQRYRTAAEFGADLLRILERRPIAAKRPGPLRAAKRWTERRPTAAVALLLGILTAIALPTIFVAKEIEKRREVDEEALRTKLALDDAVLANDRAHKSLEKALISIDRMLLRVSEEKLNVTPMMEAVRIAVLDDAVELFEEIERENPDNKEVRRRLANGLVRLGDVQQIVGRFKDAEASYGRAEKMLRNLDTRDNLDPDFPRHFASCLHSRAVLAGMLGKGGNVLPLFDEALALIDRYRGKDAERFKKFDKGWFLTGRAESAVAQKRFAEAEADLRVAIECLSILRAEVPSDLEVRAQLAGAHNRLGALLSRTGRVKEAIGAFGSARDLFLEVRSSDKNYPLSRQGLAAVYGNLALCLGELGDRDARLKAQEDGLGVLRDLIRDFPEVVLFKTMLATSLCNHASTLASIDRSAADRVWDECRRIHAGLIARFPDLERYRLDFAAACLTRAGGLQTIGDIAGAETVSRDGLDILAKLPATSNSPFADELTAQFRLTLGNSCLGRSDLVAAKAEYEGAIVAYRSLIVNYPENRAFAIELGGVLSNLAHVVRKDDPSRARALVAEAIALQTAVRAKEPENQKSIEFLRNHHRVRLLIASESGTSPEIKEAVERYVADFGGSWRDLRYAAGQAALRAAQLGDASDVAEDRGRFVELALVCLERAADEGYGDLGDLVGSKELAAIREEERYDDLVDRLEFGPASRPK